MEFCCHVLSNRILLLYWLIVLLYTATRGAALLLLDLLLLFYMHTTQTSDYSADFFLIHERRATPQDGLYPSPEPLKISKKKLQDFFGRCKQRTHRWDR